MKNKAYGINIIIATYQLLPKQLPINLIYYILT